MTQHATAKTLIRPGKQPARLKPASVVLGLLAAGLVGGVLSGTPLPLIADDRAALIALTLVGLALCGAGPLGHIAARGAWLSPAALAGVALGVVALAVVGAALAGVRLPYVAGEGEAFRVLAVIGAAKVGLGVLYRLSR
jgi:hypothetical protein